MLLAAARRFFLLLVGSSAAVTVVSLLFGALAGASVDRSVAIGFYFAGSALLIVGFFAGNRGPTRLKQGGPEPVSLFRNRVVRWATLQEQEEAINVSAVVLSLGFVLVLVGVAVDGRHSLF